MMTPRALLFTLIAIGLVLWTIFVYPTVIQVVRYYSYDKEIRPDTLQWSKEAINDELWRVRADYSFTVQGKTYTESEVFQGERYRNPYAAEVGIEKLKKEYQMVWYNSLHPVHSSVEKFFPTKRIIYGLIILGLLFYAALFIRKF